MNSRLPDDLQELQQKCNATHGDNPTLARANYEDFLRKTHMKYKSSSDPEILETLLACWFPHIKYIVKDAMLPSIYHAEIGLLVSALCKNSPMLVRCVADKNRAELLACLCLTRAQIIEQGYAHPPMNNIGTLLALWSGDPRHRDAYKSLEHAVNVIYGPACWLMYRDEVTNSSAFPGYLYDLHLPLVGVENPAANKAQGCALPFDIG